MRANSNQDLLNKSISTQSIPSIRKGQAISIGTASGGRSRITGSTDPLFSPAAATHRTSEKLVGAMVNGRYLSYKAGGFAEVTQEISVESTGTLRIGFNGRIRGTIVSIIAGFDVVLSGFIRRDGGSKKRFTLFDRSDFLAAKAFDLTYSPGSSAPGGNIGRLFRDVTPGKYRIGIELTATVSTFGPSSAVLNFHPKRRFYESDGFCNYNRIDISFVS